MKMREIAAACVLAAVGAGITACSSGGTHPASATGRAPGDNGKLLPRISCYIGSLNDSETDISVVNPGGGAGNCNTVTSEINMVTPPDVTALSNVEAPTKADIDGATVECAGIFKDDRLTVLYLGQYFTGADAAICSALRLSS